MPHPAQRLTHKKSPLNGGPIPSTAASVEAVKIAQGPFTVARAVISASLDHWNVPFRIERSEAAELQPKSIQPAERGAAEPAIV